MPLVTTVKNFLITVEIVAKSSKNMLYYNIAPCFYGGSMVLQLWLNGGFSIDKPL